MLPARQRRCGLELLRLPIFSLMAAAISWAFCTRCQTTGFPRGRWTGWVTGLSKTDEYRRKDITMANNHSRRWCGVTSGLYES